MTKHRSYEPLAWQNGSVRFLDQALLPQTTSYTETNRYEDIVDAMQRLAIRGAPLIGIAGAYAVVLAAQRHPADRVSFDQAVARIASARPTAVNLRYAVDRLLAVIRQIPFDGNGVTAALLEEAKRLHDETRAADEALSALGATLFGGPARIMTICNTGPLATGGSGTAFGVIASVWRQNNLRDLYVCETRPLLQGARLTMWELQQAGIPATLLHDSAAGSLFGQGQIDAVITGADRIAANGDTANKIGTYTLACLAEIHRVPFFVAAPTSTIDPATASGRDIPIEQRGVEEVTGFAGERVAPSGTMACTPAFDVTPAAMISAIVTEKGIFRTPYAFDGSVAGESGTR